MFNTRKSKRFAAGLVTLAVAATGVLSASTAQALLPALSAPSGAVTVAPPTGTAATNISVLPPAAAACQGDTATGGYHWETFLVEDSVDASQLSYGATGPFLTGSTAFIQPLFSQGNPILAQNTAIGTGALTGFPSAGYQLNIFNGVITTSGLYKIGLACSVGGGTGTERFWQTKIQITANATSITAYSLFAVPTAPTLVSVTAGNASLSGVFTAPASTPATISYLATATPPVGAATSVTVPAPATTFTIPGLVNGTTYSVTVATTNAAGTGPVSNAISGTPADPNQRPPVTNLQATPGIGSVQLSWTAPTGVAPTGYTIALVPNVGGPFTTTLTSFNVTGLAEGVSYTFTVTPTHPAPFVGAPASIVAVPQSASSITQDISVTRPVGGLVLTQQCGLFGALDAEPASSGFPALGALTASGTAFAPTTDPARTIPEIATKYAQYPYPVNALNEPIPTYPTHCALNMGIASLITTGTEAGKYFAATGRLNQVTVVDTRNIDAGWTLSGSVTNFSSATSPDIFSGNYLGWTPKASGTSGVTLEGYDQLTTAGPTIQPAFASGLTTSRALGTAVAGSGLGIAAFDARLRLLIPVTKDNGLYTATLTLSAT
jgi:Fibronectin type III domain